MPRAGRHFTACRNEEGPCADFPDNDVSVGCFHIVTEVIHRSTCDLSTRETPFGAFQIQLTSNVAILVLVSVLSFSVFGFGIVLVGRSA